MRSMAKDELVDECHESRRRPRLTDSDAYAVAGLVCEKGLSANRIAARLYSQEYESPNKAVKARAIMRVKHLLHRAVERGILVLNPPANERLAKALRAQPEFLGINFEIADDAADVLPLDPAEPVYREAARLVAERIDALMQAKSGEVVVANAGGPAMSRVAEYLPAVAGRHEDASRLRFVSLNAAENSERYELSANFIAVRMASIYGACHFASMRRLSSATRKDYVRVARHPDLLVCGAGAREGFLSRVLKDVYREDSLPRSVVGDVCLIPLDSRGNEVPLPTKQRRIIADELRPEPSYDTLVRLATENRVLVVLAYPRPSDSARRGLRLASPSKIEIATAILRKGLTRWCVLGSSMANQILHSMSAGTAGRLHNE
jgi:DNA-binding transcriptional regulator LsrR (DeoR family)